MLTELARLEVLLMQHPVAQMMHKTLLHSMGQK
jgi:hypothetical protein